MLKLLTFEMTKLRFLKSFKVLILLSFLIGFLSSGISSVLDSGQGLSGHQTFFYQFADLRTLIFVFAGVFSGLFIGEDFNNRTIQSEISSGFSRFSILLSKTIVYMIGVCVLIIVQVVTNTISTSYINGFGNSLTLEVLSQMLRALFVFMYLACSCCMVYVATSFYLKNVGATIAINMLLLVVLDALFQVGAMISVTGMKIYEFTPFVQMVLSSLETVMSGQLGISILIGTASMIVFFLLAYNLFYKAELK